MSVKVAAIAAMSENRVIGKQGDLPWRIPEDLKRFRQLTKGHPVIMGRKTYDSLPSEFKPLPGRKNIVITREPERFKGIEGVDCYSSLNDAINELKMESSNKGLIWVIGGAQIYNLTLPLWDEVFLTLVHKNVEGDAFFPQFEENFELIDNTPKDGFTFQHYVRKHPS